jgi:peroxiredoxin
MSVIGWIVIGVVGLAVVALWSLVYQLVRQQGQILIRLDELEELASGGQPRPAATRPAGLAVGTVIPPFRLPDVSGAEVALEDFRGKRVLLVHWDPGCGFCRQIGPELAALQPSLRKRETELILVSHRDAESNTTLAEEHGLECPILLQAERQTIAAFTGLGTPSAYLVNEEGRVAKPIAIGADRVPVLVSEAARGRAALASERSLAESRIERTGILAGSPAPGFDLPDLQGRRISLEDYRGRRVLVVFSDPTCGPCDAVACDLARFEREHRENGLELLMVSRGPVEDNRRKASEQGIEFPVVVQPGWNVSKQYGIFATPVAFLVDESGTIAREVARGGVEIMQLALEALPAGQ